MMSKGNEDTRGTPAPAKGSGGWRLGVVVVSVLAVVAFAAWCVLVWRADHAGVPQISAPIGLAPVQAPPRDNDQARSVARTSPPRPTTAPAPVGETPVSPPPAAPLVAAGNTNKPPVAPVTAVSADTRTAAEKAADEAIAEAQALLGESEGVTDDVVATQPARRP